MTYELELEKVIKKIKKLKPNTVLIQLPDGLKPKAKEIADEIEQKTKATPIIYLASCYGPCDTPNVKNIDLLIQWGHSKWK